MTSAKKIMFYGDSLIEGPMLDPKFICTHVVSTYIEEKKLNCEVINCGKSGDGIMKTKTRLTTELIKFKPDIIVLCLGGNDFFEEKWKNVDVVRAEFKTIISFILDAKIKLVLVGISPLSLDFFFPFKDHGTFGKMLSFFSMYEELSTEYNIPLVKSIFQDIPKQDKIKILLNLKNGNLMPRCILKEEYFLDAAHPNDKGHAVMGLTLFNCLFPLING